MDEDKELLAMQVEMAMMAGEKELVESNPEWERRATEYHCARWARYDYDRCRRWGPERGSARV